MRQNSLERAVLFLYFSVLKDFLWLAYLVLKVVSYNPMYLFLSWFYRLEESVASYIMFDVRQFCFNGHKSFCMQLVPGYVLLEQRSVDTTNGTYGTTRTTCSEVIRGSFTKNLTKRRMGRLRHQIQRDQLSFGVSYGLNQ